jgi:hypothetical protein
LLNNGSVKTVVAKQWLINNQAGIPIDANAADSWSNELVVRQLPAGKNVSTEAEGIVGSVNR